MIQEKDSKIKTLINEKVAEDLERSDPKTPKLYLRPNTHKNVLVNKRKDRSIYFINWCAKVNISSISWNGYYEKFNNLRHP